MGTRITQIQDRMTRIKANNKILNCGKYRERKKKSSIRRLRRFPQIVGAATRPCPTNIRDAFDAFNVFSCLSAKNLYYQQIPPSGEWRGGSRPCQEKHSTAKTQRTQRRRLAKMSAATRRRSIHVPHPPTARQ